jgi:hypothetical protein
MTAYYETPLFDPQPGRDYTPEGTRDGSTPTHAHTGPDCVFCATRNGPAAKAAGTAAVTRDLAWWEEADRWLELQPIGDTFTADDLVSVIGKPVGSPNQIGARLRSWAGQDAIAHVGFAEATRRESHGRVVRIWQVMA